MYSIWTLWSMVVAVVIITIEKNRHLVVNGLGLAFSRWCPLPPYGPHIIY